MVLSSGNGCGGGDDECNGDEYKDGECNVDDYGDGLDELDRGPRSYPFSLLAARGRMDEIRGDWEEE